MMGGELSELARAYADCDQDDPAALPSRWTAAHVQNRLIEAMSVIRRTPMRIGPKQFGTAWPQIMQDYAELIDQTKMNEALSAGNWKTVEMMTFNARKEIQDQKARDAAESQKRSVRSDLPTAAQNSRAEQALRWCSVYLQGVPQQAGSLSLWAWCRSAFFGSSESERRAAEDLSDKSINEALKARRALADKMVERRRKELGAVKVDRTIFLECQQEAVAWANARLAAKSRQFAKLKEPPPSATAKGREATDKYASRKRAHLSDCAWIRQEAKARFQQRLQSRGAFQEKVIVRRRDVMPDVAMSRTWLDEQRKAAAAAIAEYLNRDGVRVR